MNYLVQLFNFSDFREERKLFNKHILPEIREYCLRNKLDFEVTDLHLAVNEQDYTSEEWQKLYRREIDICRQKSIGPCFIVRYY